MYRMLPLVTLAACAAAAASCLVQHHLSFIEVDATTGLPVANPNGIIEPGEGALITISMSFMPEVGAVVIAPGIPSVGELRMHAFRSTSFISLLGGACGTWTDYALQPGFSGTVGNPSWCGSGFPVIGATQPAAGANQDNPVAVWQGIFVPDDYSSRTVLFRTSQNSTHGFTSATLWVRDTGPPEEFIGIVCPADLAQIHIPIEPTPDPCYPDCDTNGTLNVDDFLCFINEFAAASTLPPSQQITHYANCDGSTAEPILTVDDFLCFINAFAQGCP